MNAKTHYLAGLSHSYQNPIKKNMVSAIEHFLKAADLGYADAYFFLGRIFLHGDGVSRDEDKAFELFKKGMEFHSYKCMFALGFYYKILEENNKNEDMYQTFIKTSYPKIIEEHTKNDIVSTHIIGLFYFHGLGVKKSRTEALKYFLLAAEEKFSESLYMAGIVYLELEETKYHEKALDYLKQAASYDHIGASYTLGVEYFKVENYEEGVSYFKKAAIQNEVESMYMLSLYYEEKARDYQEAFTYTAKAANLLHEKALYKMGLYYDQGIGVKKNTQEALRWYERAIVQYKDAKAAYNTAIILMEDKEKNIEKIKELLELAAKKNHRYAQYNLAVMYHIGDGVSVNIHKALFFFKQSAEQGFDRAQYNLGLFYYLGEQVEKNIEEATYWFDLAAKNGLKQAQELLEKIKKLEAMKHENT